MADGGAHLGDPGEDTASSPDCSLIAFWMLSMKSLICESLALRGPSLSQSLIVWSPATDWSARSVAPCATCCPANVSSAATAPRVVTTTRNDDSAAAYAVPGQPLDERDDERR